MSAPNPPAWVGWYRLTPTGPWLVGATGECIEQCHKRLRAKTRTMNLRNRDTCITTGAVPNVKPFYDPRI
jgi:hypothetical protein